MNKNSQDIVVVSAVRTPLGMFGGTLRGETAFDIGASAIKSCIDRTTISPNDITRVIMGCCRQAGNGPNPARTASVKAGIPTSIPAYTLNMACPSGLMAVQEAAVNIKNNPDEIIIAGGMESMSSMPFLLKDCRWDGKTPEDSEPMDSWLDTIDPLTGNVMGVVVEYMAKKYNLSREQIDEYAFTTHNRAIESVNKGYFAEEIAPYKNSEKDILLENDETIRFDTSLEKLSSLKSSFIENGVLTAGNCSKMADGAACLMLMTRQKAIECDVKPLFSIHDFIVIANEPSVFAESPGIALNEILKKNNLDVKSADLIELNEAFAVQMLGNMIEHKFSHDNINVCGGAIALGHPSGVSGARILVTLYYALKRLDHELGIAAIGGVGGVGTSMIIKRES